MSRRFPIAILSLLAIALIVLPGLGCRGGSKEAKSAQKQVDLTIWRVFDDSDTFRDVIDEYKKFHPNVRINYKKLRFDEYQDELLQAFAEDRGPDIFVVHNTWMKKYLPLIEPMPDTLRITYKEVQGTVKKEEVVVLRNEPTMSLRELNDKFVQVVSDDVVYPATNDDGTRNRIHGLPLAVDSLALFYNKDILDAAGIPEPPRTWENFLENVVALTKYDATGGIAQSGAAIGTGSNVERSSDIISLLMMQSGTQMSAANGVATFSKPAQGSRVPAAINAIRFYTDFANSTKEAYTWDPSFTNSVDAFATGQTAFFIGYSYHIPLIEARAQKLNYGISPVPQLSESQQINYANYWIETVSKKSDNADWAWDFVQFAADKDHVGTYLARAKKPTALRSLILGQLDDLQLSVFADQVLTAQDWYNGNDAISAEQALIDMLDDVVAGTFTIEEALPVAEQQVNQTL